LKYITIGSFRLDLRAGELTRKGYAARLQEQSFTILKMLTENPGEVVLREEIRKRLWPNDTLVDFDHSVNAAVNKLREALGDKAKAPRYIETVARRGYRLIAKVEVVETADVSPATAEPAPAPQSASLQDLVGTLIGRYRLVELLGGGGMGVVYKAEDLNLGRPVALKFPPPDQWGDAGSRARLEREARVGAALNHPNICHIYEVGEHEGKPFIAMQFLRGETLGQRLAAGALPPGEAVSIASRVAAGLEAAHHASLVHGDIKPANIFLTSEGEIKILDFGLASPISQAPRAPAGTAAYMSPEQSECLPLDARSDLYSLGRVLAEATAQPRPPVLEAVIRRATESDLERRYRSAAELRTALEGIRLNRPSRSSIAAAVAVLLLIAVAVVAGSRWPRAEPAERSLTGNAPEDAVDAVSVSPRGNLLAFARGATLFVGVVTDVSQPAKSISLAAPIRSLAWSHDAKRVYAALEDGRLYTFEPSGTVAPQLLREHAASPAVSPDDSSIAFLDDSGTNLWIMRADGSAAETIFHVRSDFHLAYPHWAAPGTLVFAQVSSGNVNCGGWISAWNAASRQTTDIVRLISCLGGIATIDNSRILYLARNPADAQLYELPLNGAASPRVLRDHLGKVDTLSASADGAIYYRKTTDIVSVYVGDLVPGAALANVRRVSATENNSNYVHGWTADSRSVLFESLRGDQYFLFRKPIDAAGPDSPLPGSEDGVGPKLSPDGAWVLFNRSVKLPSGEPGSRYQLVRLPIAGGVAETVADDPGAFNFHCGTGRDARCVLLAEHQGKLHFRVLDPVRGAGAELAPAEQRPIDWDLSPDGNRLATISPGAPSIHVIDVARNSPSDLQVPGWAALHTINWSADGSGWLVCAERAPVPGAFLLNVNGAGASVVHQFKAPCPWAVPSPNGKHVAFSELSPGVNVRSLVP
jgi:eukaryotic-like serine/threonine-protein kinase